MIPPHPLRQHFVLPPLPKGEVKLSRWESCRRRRLRGQMKNPPVVSYRGYSFYPNFTILPLTFRAIPGTFAMTPAAMAVQIISGTI